MRLIVVGRVVAAAVGGCVCDCAAGDGAFGAYGGAAVGYLV